MNSPNNLLKLAMRAIAAATILFLASCGNGDSSGSSGNSASSGSSPTVTAAEALRTMEASGQLPILDRSSSLPGIDADSNGVRDDLDAYIASLPDTAPQKIALAQMARAINGTMTVDVTNATALGVAGAELGDAVNCIWSRFDPAAASPKVEDMRKLMVNTRQRYDAYVRYNLARSGAVIDLPTGDICR